LRHNAAAVLPEAGTSVIPVVDIADYIAGRPGALDAAGRRLHDALTTTGFFILTGHGVPQPLVTRTFAEARRFHELPMEKKLALKLNEHNNGYMVMGRYAVRTSTLNTNDRGDLNEAFFMKRERPADDPLLLSGRRFVGPNQWPVESDLPEFRANMLEYARVMDRFVRHFMPIVAIALDLPPDWFDEAFTDSMRTLRLSHYPPVTPGLNEFGIAPHTDSNFMTFLAQTEIPGCNCACRPRDRMAASGSMCPTCRIPSRSIPATRCTAGRTAAFCRRRTEPCRRAAATATRSRSSSGRASIR